MDDHTNGLRASALVVVIARPSRGRSNLLTREIATALRASR
ncbi:MAG: hypothetical protein E6H01_08895 [Bacillati bacterium ANGP1]|uniref:Uncharacterized protein n=1 Tax=Candidatus Segetimicrobium genomatis TaxID=2569760 RepID=A0A537KY87_9BACT|nr:MAG: hypothetical protein E6H01_08895 [Terrabacteria group bacterium ANGP1]